MGHGQQQGHVRADADGQVEIGHVREIDFARVGDDHLGPALEGLFDPGRGHGVALGHVGADAEDQVGFVHVGEGVRHGTASDRGCQTGNRGRVSGTATVVYVVGAVAPANELLEAVVGLRRRAAGGDAVDGVATVLGEHLGKALGGAVERGVPVGGVELAVLAANEGLGEPVAVLDEVKGKLALDTQRAFVGRTVHGRLDADEFIPFGQQIHRAANAAVRTDRAGLCDLAGQVGRAQGLFVGEGAGGTGLDALAAKGAGRILEQAIELRGDLLVEAAPHGGDGVVAFLLGADADAAVARDAQVVVAQDEGVVVGGMRLARLDALEAAGAGLVAIDEGG